uniref:NPL4-like protein 1 n=1 Tax=Zea mays TaxID=4577 RepID=A0A804MMU4_MAIZE
MRWVGLVFTQAVGRKPSETGEYTMSNREVMQAAQLQAEGGIPKWVTAIVKLEVGDDGTGDVHFEAFQMSEICVKLFKDGVLETEVQDADDPRLSKMRKEVVAGGKDTMEVDNDFFLVPVKISDHQSTQMALRQTLQPEKAFHPLEEDSCSVTSSYPFSVCYC